MTVCRLPALKISKYKLLFLLCWAHVLLSYERHTRPAGRRMGPHRTRISMAKQRFPLRSAEHPSRQRSSAARKPGNAAPEQSRKCNLYLVDFQAEPCPRSRWVSL